MRRTAARAVMARGKPIYEVLMLAQPGKPKLWSQQMEVLNKANVLSVNMWLHMDDATKNKLTQELTPDAFEVVDNAIQHAMGHETKPHILVLYGSQTGTAEAYAKMISSMALSHGYEPRLLSMNDAVAYMRSGNVAKPKAVVYVLSTYGVGEFPSNAREFMSELERSDIPNELRVPYAIFGLGNSKNETYNVAAKKLDKALRLKGCKSLMRMQLSCELQPNGHDAAFRSWKRGLWAAMGTTTHSQGTLGVSYKCAQAFDLKPDEHILHRLFFDATVHQNNCVTPKDYEPKAYELHFQLPMINQKEQLGGMVHGRRAVLTDWVEIYPYNNDDLVNRALKQLKWTGEHIYEITPLAGSAPSDIDHKKITLRTLLREITNLSGLPTRSFLETLSLAASDPTERTKLEDLANDLSDSSAYEKLAAGIFTVVDALEMFPSVSLTVEQMLTHAPRIKARTYSLAQDNTKSVHEDFEIVYTVPHREAASKSHDGLATGFLSRMRAGDRFKMMFRPSGLTVPPDTEPLVICALGTGIGAARALLQHRANAKAAGVAVPRAKLFYGFRHSGKDQLYTRELAQLEKDGIVEVEYVASNDVAGKFTPAMDKFTPDVAKTLGSNGHFYYCGLGGSVPSMVESALRRVGVDVSALRGQGRIHEEFFNADSDVENLLKGHAGQDVKGDTLAKRMGNCEMFCFQCEQTFQNKGCHKVGVCGKTPRVAALQDLTVHLCKELGFYLHHLRALKNADNVADNQFLLGALFSTLTNVNFDEVRFVEYIRQLQSRIASAKLRYESAAGAEAKKLDRLTLTGSLPNVDKLVELGKAVGVLSRFTDPARQSLAGVAEMLMYGLKGIAAYTDHSLMNNKEDPAVYAFIQEALAYLAQPDAVELGEALKLCLRAGEANVSSMKLLYESNATLGVPSPAPVSQKPKPGKCILVSGHDLVILKGLLEVTEPLGINVYTHGEMLPAHGYPLLRKHKNLAGQFGGAWMRQSVEFPHFPGPILMTTNCLTEPHESYRDQLFTAGAVGWSGITHIGNTMSDIRFDRVIEAAQSCKGFTDADKEFTFADPVGQARPAALTVGFGHEAVLGAAPAIIEQIQKGNITRFFLVGGCDGYEGQRSYYTELVKRLPKTCVVLTVGCGKYRINHLDLGCIGDTQIPRLLDLGQCNDSFSAVQIAVALAGVLKCNVSDLPLSIVLSWFEQKAIAVLLSCLHLGLKPIHVGPSLPAFLTPEVLGVLVKDFGIRVCGDPEKDLAEMLAAKGAS